MAINEELTQNQSMNFLATIDASIVSNEVFTEQSLALSFESALFGLLRLIASNQESIIISKEKISIADQDLVNKFVFLFEYLTSKSLAFDKEDNWYSVKIGNFIEELEFLF